MTESKTTRRKGMSDGEFLLIIHAVCSIGDGRENHIRSYKRLLRIVAKADKNKEIFPKQYARFYV